MGGLYLLPFSSAIVHASQSFDIVAAVLLAEIFDMLASN